MQAERSRRTTRPETPADASCDSAAMQGRHLCPVLASVGVIGTEWRLAIIHRLLEGPQRFSEILKSSARLNAKTLSATLKYLENQGVVQRHVISTRPFSVTYSLTEMGMGLAPVARELRAWGERWLVPRATPAARPGTSPRRTPAIQGELPRIVLADTEGHRTQ
jgi:DNA-binding HxlR family transcriptional regulator